MNKEILMTRNRLGPFVLLLLALALVGIAGPARAADEFESQPTADARNDIIVDTPQAEASRAKADKSLFETLRDGGVLMVPLFGSSMLMMVFVFERAISLRRARVAPGPFVKRFMHQLREGKLDRESALALCGESQTPAAMIFQAAAKKWGRASVEVEQAVLDAGERAANGLRRYLRLFNAIATIAPLLGLLGTVFGMIRIFHDIAASSAMGRAEMLAGGISEAMLTTATGLSVAIPALCFYTFFQSRVDRLVVELDELGQEVVGLLSAEALQEDRARAARTNRRGAAA
jgi:biopolymer transport protein ExbB